MNQPSRFGLTPAPQAFYVRSLPLPRTATFKPKGGEACRVQTVPGSTATEGLAATGLDLSMKLMAVEQCVAEWLAALRANRVTHIAGRMNRIMATLIPGFVMRKMKGLMLARALANQQTPTV